MYSDGVRLTFVRSVAGMADVGARLLLARDATAAGITVMKLPAMSVVSILLVYALFRIFGIHVFLSVPKKDTRTLKT